MKDFAGKNVLITGAAHGIGRLMAEMIAGMGGALVLCDLNAAGLEETAAALRRGGTKVWTRVLDISDREAVYEAARSLEKEPGRIDVLINNAGVVYTGEILTLSDDLHRKQVEVNLLGNLWMIKAFAPAMVARNAGHIVNIASSAGLLAMPGMGMYSATKHAIVGLNDALRNELRNCGARDVKVLVVCPYLIKTGMFEGMTTPFYLPGLEPEAMARAVVKGILRGKKIVGKPGMVFLPPVIKALFGLSALDAFLRFTGYDKAVYSCKGFSE